MANQEQLAILRQGVDVWNKWRGEMLGAKVDLRGADLMEVFLGRANLVGANLLGTLLNGAQLTLANLREANLTEANFKRANLFGADLSNAELSEANLSEADLSEANLSEAKLRGTNLRGTKLNKTNLQRTDLQGANFSSATTNSVTFGDLDLREAIGLQTVRHRGPSVISTSTFTRSKGKIPEVFLKGCGLSDWEIEVAKLYDPDLNNAEINDIQYKMYDLRATQALQISPLFISYSHGNSAFVDKLERYLNNKGVRFWRDIHDMKAGRMETQIDRGIRQNPTVLLVLSEHSSKSDWVEHEVRMARELAKEMGRDVLCPVALDDSWKSSPWPKRIMEQIMEYNILDFSAWEDHSKFEGIFRKLIDGLELFYKG